MDWKIVAAITPIFFVTYQTLSKLLPKGTSSFLVNAYASLAGLIIMLVLHLLTSQNKSLTLSGKSLPLALGMGILIGVGNYGIIKAYSLGAPQSIFTPLFYVILIVYGTLFGVLLWHEKMTILQVIGTAFSVVGLLIIMYAKK